MHLKIKVVDFLRDLLWNSEARNTYMDILGLRQVCFSESSPGGLFLDPLDLISVHLAVYSTELNQSVLVGASRILPQSRCEAHGVSFPLEEIVRTWSPAHRQAFDGYRAHVGDMMNIGYLCVNTQFRSAHGGFRLADVLSWLSARWVSRMGESNLCFFLNQKYRMERWIQPIGPWPALPPAVHPVVKEPHNLVLMRKINANYFQNKTDLEPLLDEALILPVEKKKAA